MGEGGMNDLEDESSGAKNRTSGIDCETSTEVARNAIHKLKILERDKCRT